MKYIVTDLEMNPISYEHKELWPMCRSEVIEIGAVLLDENYKETDSFKTYVRPKYNKAVANNIKKLTGITTEMLSEASDFETEIHRFFSWCLAAGDSVQIVQWSQSDREQILREIQLKEILLSEQETKLMDCWCDLQKEYDTTVGMEKNTSLSNAIMFAGKDFEGSMHDALTDAKNTARLLETLRNPEKLEEALGSVISVMKGEPLAPSLGDLFDFSFFDLQP